MGKMLINGRLRDKPAQSKSGFSRPKSEFRIRNWSTACEVAAHDRGRYRLYISKACPWCHVATMVLALRNLGDWVDIVDLKPKFSPDGWMIARDDHSARSGFRHNSYLYELYLRTDLHYSGLITAPVLWDEQQQKIVSNDSQDITRWFGLLQAPRKEGRRADSLILDLYPPQSRSAIDVLNRYIYRNVSNRFYEVGFAANQPEYDLQVGRLFEALTTLDERLAHRQYLMGSVLTESDLRLFASLLRYELVYYAHFKANFKSLAAFPNLAAHTRRLLRCGRIASTVDVKQIKQHYYQSHANLNPSGIVPIGPNLGLLGLESEQDDDHLQWGLP